MSFPVGNFTLHPLIHTQVGCTVAQSVGLGKVTFY